MKINKEYWDLRTTGKWIDMREQVKGQTEDAIIVFSSVLAVLILFALIFMFGGIS